MFFVCTEETTNVLANTQYLPFLNVRNMNTCIVRPLFLDLKFGLSLKQASHCTCTGKPYHKRLLNGSDKSGKVVSPTGYDTKILDNKQVTDMKENKYWGLWSGVESYKRRSLE